MKFRTEIPLLLLVFAAVSFQNAQAEDTDEKIRKALSRKISFDFTDTPLVEAIETVRRLSNLTLVIDPKALAEFGGRPVTLRINEGGTEEALGWICKLAEVEYRIQKQCVYISAPGTPLPVPAAQRPMLEAEDEAGPTPGILRAKFATGDMIEADDKMLQRFPQLVPEILSLAIDPVKDGILVIVPGHDIPSSVNVDAFIESATALAPAATFKFDERLKLLYVRSTHDVDLRRINAIARALRRSGPNGPPPPPPLAGPPPEAHADLSKKITLKVADKPLRQVLDHMGAFGNVLVMAGDRDAKKRFGEPITLDLNDMELRECFDLVAQLTELRYEVNGDTYSFFNAAPKNPPGAHPGRAESIPKDKPANTADRELQF